VKKTDNKNKLRAIDFFCGAGGMSCGMEMADIQVLAGIDIDESCKSTYEYNHKNSKFILADIKKLTFEELANETGIEIDDDNLLFIGCSPCQYWSIIRTKRDKASLGKNLLLDFKRFVEHFNPGNVVIENVPGIMSNKDESGLDDFLKFLEEKKYNVAYDVINTKNYGIPQTRRRFVLVASRVKKVSIPDKTNEPCNVKDFIGVKNGFKKIAAGHRDTTDFMHTVAGLRQINLDRLSKTEVNGGTRNAWANDEDLQLETYKVHTEGFKDVYGRMSWDKPGPTITTKFFSLSNGRFGHPDELRAISLREGATLQTFPKEYIFKEKSIAANARLIGNAVPPKLSFQIANSLI
jgi:DNA (cytosine-5)-methyltransferase 1